MILRIKSLQYLHLFVLLLVMTISQSLQAQFFSNSYDLNEDANTGWNVISTVDGLLILAGSRCNLNTESCTGILKTDFDGNVIWTRIIEGFKTPTYNSILVDQGNIYLVLQPNAPVENKIKVLKLDMAGNTLAEWDLGETQEYEIPLGILKYRNGFVIYSLLFPPGSEETAWILYADATFTPIHEVFFVEEDTTYGLVVSKDLLATQDGNLLATQYIAAKGGVTKLDSAGQVIWHTRLPFTSGPDNVSEIHATELQDGGYAVSWFRDRHDVDTLIPYAPAVFRLDQQGEVVWERAFDLPYEDNQLKYLTNLFTTANGDIVGTGYRVSYREELGRHAFCGWIFRLDADTGEVFWERTLCDLSHSQEYDMAFLNGTEFPNGDLAFTGAYTDTFPNHIPFINNPNVWLVHVSAQGCLVENCGPWTIIHPDGTITAVEVVMSPEKKHFAVYPNPGNGQVRIAPKANPWVTIVKGKSPCMTLGDDKSK